MLGQSVTDLEILKGEEEGNLSPSSYFITNEHNQLYAFYTGKGLTEQNSEASRGTAAPTPALPF